MGLPVQNAWMVHPFPFFFFFWFCYPTYKSFFMAVPLRNPPLHFLAWILTGFIYLTFIENYHRTNCLYFYEQPAHLLKRLEGTWNGLVSSNQGMKQSFMLPLHGLVAKYPSKPKSFVPWFQGFKGHYWSLCKSSIFLWCNPEVEECSGQCQIGVKFMI